MIKLKIKKEYAKAILSGEKEYELRKLSKGICTEEVEFVSICEPKKTYFTAKLTPLTLFNKESKGKYFKIGKSWLDNKTYDWAVENYLGKHDFVMYSIDNIIKEVDND